MNTQLHFHNAQQNIDSLSNTDLLAILAAASHFSVLLWLVMLFSVNFSKIFGTGCIVSTHSPICLPHKSQLLWPAFNCSICSVSHRDVATSDAFPHTVQAEQITFTQTQNKNCNCSSALHYCKANSTLQSNPVL